MWRTLVTSICLMMMLLAIAGCASSSSEAQEKVPVYPASLAGQNCAIMVWAGWNTTTEYQRVQLDLAKMIQERLVAKSEAAREKEKDKDKDKAAPKVRFINPASVVRFQREHPEIEGLPIAEVAPRLGVDRVIYVELESFQTQSPQSVLLLKGAAQATLRVVEVAGAKATIAFEEPGIKVYYPRKAPEGLAPSDRVNVRTIYVGTLSTLADEVAARFENF